MLSVRLNKHLIYIAFEKEDYIRMLIMFMELALLMVSVVLMGCSCSLIQGYRRLPSVVCSAKE